MQKLSFLKPAIPLTVISIVIALLLAVVNAVTADKIVQNALEEKITAIEGIFSDCDSFTSASGDLYENTVNDAGTVLNAGGEVIGYFAEVSPVGFKGEIKLVVGADTDGEIIKVSLLSASETPGVGTKATDQANLDKYIGHESENVDEIDTITGATISSRAVRSGIRNAETTIEAIIKEGK